MPAKLSIRKFFSRQTLTRLILATLVLWVAWLTLAGDTSLLRLWKLKRENQQLRSHIAELKQRLEDIEEEKARLKDPEYLEKIAREEYGLIRDGETCYRIVEVPGDSAR